MKKVKLLTARAEMNANYKPGDVISLPDDEAARCIEGGLAVEVTAKPEAAMVGDAENAMQKPSTPRKRRNK